MADSIFQVWTRSEQEVSSGIPFVADQISFAEFISAKYFVTYEGNGLSKTLLLSVRKAGLDVESIVTNKHGDPMDVGLDAVYSTGNMEIKVTNNTGHAIKLIMARAKI